MIAKHLDLNLLMIFDAILAEGHVTRAAERLAMSQSAVSKGLAQLRQAFGDPLFLRASRGVVPTHRALEIADQVRQAIAALNSLAGPVTEFDARSAHAHFNIGATDYVSFVLLPGLMRRLQETAPHVSLTLHDMESMMPEEMLLAGKVDLVISSVASVNFPSTARSCSAITTCACAAPAIPRWPTRCRSSNSSPAATWPCRARTARASAYCRTPCNAWA